MNRNARNARRASKFAPGLSTGEIVTPPAVNAKGPGRDTLGADTVRKPSKAGDGWSRPLTSRAVNDFDRLPSLNPLGWAESRDVLKLDAGKLGPQESAPKVIGGPTLRPGRKGNPDARRATTVHKIGTGKAR